MIVSLLGIENSSRKNERLEGMIRDDKSKKAAVKLLAAKMAS
jgi:hypothetical protein